MSEISLFDTHAHLTSSELLPNVESILERAKQVGVERILNICTDPKSLEEGLALEKRVPWVQNAGATTPHDVEKEGEASFGVFARRARSGELTAIGETGLDYHYEHSAKKLQQEFLIRYLHLALECQLPVIFHCREAFSDLFAIADCEYTKGSPAILHCFTGTVEEAREAIGRGWLISFSGIITFKKSESLREVVRKIPIEYLLIETDSPYLSPQTRRGKINEPSFIIETLDCLAGLKGLSPAQCADKLSENGAKILRDC